MVMQAERHKAVWLRMLAIKELRMKRDVYKTLKAQAKQIANAYLRDGHAGADDKAREVSSDWLKVLIPNYTVTIRDFAIYVREQLNAKSIKADFTDVTTAFIRQQSIKKAVELTDTTKKIIAKVISDGEKEGLGVEPIARNIVKTVGVVAQPRAAVIARTETHIAASFAMQEQAKDIGFEVTKTWVAVEDDRTRPTHSEVDGETVPVDDYFEVGGEFMRYPGDPNASAENVINCRCTLIYTPVRNSETFI